MAGASDKARFYLEQYVPELQEYERKEIFSREEITSIASKRSDFEHTLNARGSKPSDYARYVTYEMNLDSLRKKRCKRLGVKSTTFSGQRTIFFLLDRATKKFPGDMGLWMQYVHYCQKEKANKKLAKVFTSVLRLRPREYGLWVLAAKHYAENQGDMRTARSYMQRGLRFCKDKIELWLEYVRLEMVYLAKLAARRKILGLDEKSKTERAQKQNPEEDENMLMLPTITPEDVDPDESKGMEEVDANALRKLESAPIFTGAIPIAIFDSAMKQFANDVDVAERVFDLAASFDYVPSTKRILQHILDDMQATSPHSSAAVICEAKMSLFGIEAQTAEFPAALGASLAVLKTRLSDLSDDQAAKLAESAVLMLLPYVKVRIEIDEDVLRVLEASIRRYLRTASEIEDREGRPSIPKNRLAARLLKKLKDESRDAEADILSEYIKALGLV